MTRRLPEDWRGLAPLEDQSGKSDRGKLFEELALPALDDLYRVACRLEGDPARAGDLFQEALLVAFRKFSQLGRASSFRAWAVTILRRTYFNLHRRAEPIVSMADAGANDSDQKTFAVPEPAPDERLLARRLARELSAALDGLAPEQRLAVFLIDVQGFSYAEAAEALGAPPVWPSPTNSSRGMERPSPPPWWRITSATSVTPTAVPRTTRRRWSPT